MSKWYSVPDMNKDLSRKLRKVIKILWDDLWELVMIVPNTITEIILLGKVVFGLVSSGTALFLYLFFGSLLLLIQFLIRNLSCLVLIIIIIGVIFGIRFIAC